MVAEKSWINHCCQQLSSPCWGGFLFLLPLWREPSVRKSSCEPQWLSLGLDKAYDRRRRDHTNKDWECKGSSGAWNTRSHLDQYPGSLIKWGWWRLLQSWANPLNQRDIHYWTASHNAYLWSCACQPALVEGKLRFTGDLPNVTFLNMKSWRHSKYRSMENWVNHCSC